MSWEKSSYTKAGAALLSESLSGGALTITRAASGTGSVDTDLSAETAVSGDTHELSLLGIETVTDDGKTARKVSIQATGAADTYVMHQIGVFGVLNDGAETLLFIMQDERGIEVPAASTNSEFSFEIAVLLAVSAEANMSIAVDPQVQALMKLVKAEIEKHNANADAHAATITAAVSAAVDAHNGAENAHSDIRASVAAMNASIKAIELKFGTNVTKNPFSATFGSLDGLTVTGVWNAEQARVEF